MARRQTKAVAFQGQGRMIVSLEDNMMKKHYFCALPLALLSLAPAYAESPVRPMPSPGAFTMTPFVATDVTVGGEFVKATKESFSGAGTALGQPFNAAMTFSVKTQKFDDVYETPMTGGVSINYGLSDHQELFGRLSYSQASGKRFNVGTIDSAITWGGQALAANSTLQGKLDAYRDWSLEGGYRHFLKVKQAPAFKPFVSGAVGLRYVNAIKADISIDGSPLISDMRFYDKTIAWQTGLGLGFRWDLSPGIAAGFETGVIYKSGLKGDDKILGAGPLNKANDAGERWTVPISAGLTVAF